MPAPTHTPVDLTDEQRANLARAPDLSKADSKDAELTLTLLAASGYYSTETRQISANQWSEILMICADAEMRAKMRAAPDLLEALLQIDGEASAKEPSDRRTVGFDHLLGEADFANDLADEAFQDGLVRGIWLAAQIARAAITKATGYSSALAALNAETNEMVALSNGRLG